MTEFLFLLSLIPLLLIPSINAYAAVNTAQHDCMVALDYNRLLMGYFNNLANHTQIDKITPLYANIGNDTLNIVSCLK
jgi:hypothetical protein